MGWFTNLKISVKLMISYIILCVLMICVGAAGILGLRTMNTNSHSLYYDSLAGISNIKDAAMHVESMRLSLQRMVLPSYRDRIPALEEEIKNYTEITNQCLANYEKAISNPDDRAMFQELQKLLTSAREKRQIVMDLAKRGDYESAADIYINQAVPSNVALIKYLDKMSEWNDNVGKIYIKNTEDSFDSAMSTMIGIIIFSIILAMVLGYFISRSIVNPLSILVGISNEVASGNLTRKIETNRLDEVGMLERSTRDMVTNLRDIVTNVQCSADNVAASSEELTASADQSAQASNSVAISIMNVAQGAEKQLVIVGETVNTAEKMSAEAQQVAANANIVAATSEKTAQSAESGLKAVETAISQMVSIQKTVETLAEEITGLGMRSKEIGQIVETISGISGQTNLLALNAAIEAARAGEQGRGFAVVAEEVRKLAEQSQEAAKQISSLIGGIQNDTSKAVQAMEAGTREVKVGSELVNSAGVAFKEISGLIGQTSTQVKEISEAIGQMANDSQTVVAGAQEIDAVSRETSSQTQSVSAATEEQLASMQEIASASQALAKRAEELQVITQRFIM